MILIDSRERFSDIALKVFTLRDIQAIINVIPGAENPTEDFYTDYLITSDDPDWPESVAIQRKTVSEVLSQMEEIRTRSHKMLNLAKHAVLIIENRDSIRFSEEGNMTVKRNYITVEVSQNDLSFFGFIDSLKADGIDVIETQSYRETLCRLSVIHHRIQQLHYPKRPVGYSPLEQAIGCLCCAKGVGEKTAKAILEQGSIKDYIAHYALGLSSKQYESLKEMFNATTHVKKMESKASIDFGKVEKEKLDAFLKEIDKELEDLK